MRIFGKLLWLLAVMALFSAEKLSATGLTPIYTIQGSGFSSGLVGTTVTTEGVVTGFFEGNTPSNAFYNGFFIQDEAGDGNANTSDGLYVTVGSATPTVDIGDRVQATGTVQEYGEFDNAACEDFCVTWLDSNNSNVSVVGSGSIAPETVNAPTDGDEFYEYFEAREGMLLQFNGDGTVVGPTDFGAIDVLPASFGVDNVLRNSPEVGRQVGLRHYERYGDINGSDAPALLVGSTVGNVSGPLMTTYGMYTIVTQDGSPWNVVDSQTFPDVPTWPSPGFAEFSVVTYNTENYLSNDATKRSKVVLSLVSMGCPTFVALQEVRQSVVMPALISELASEGCPYDYANSLPDIGNRGNAVMWRTDQTSNVTSTTEYQSCSPVGSPSSVAYDDFCDDDPGNPLFSRRPVVVSAQVYTGCTVGQPQDVTIIGNHFVSQIGNDPARDQRRLEQGQFVQSIVASLSAAGDSNIIVAGDLNDYEDSPPVLALTASNTLVNAWDYVDSDDLYSYNFRGVSQIIDHLLHTPELDDNFIAAAPIHYNSNIPTKPYEDVAGTVWSSSDHDPVVATYNACEGEGSANSPYLSFDVSGAAGGITYAPSDIIVQNNGLWETHFDGSDVELTSANIDAFQFYAGDSILMSFDSAITIEPIGLVEPEDIVLFTPSSLGANTDGTFSLAFDGSDVGLSGENENVDAIAVYNGKLAISTSGAVQAGGISAEDEDMLQFDATSFGNNTAGGWTLLFDGSDVFLGNDDSRDIDGAWVDAFGDLHLSPAGSFDLFGLNFNAADVGYCASTVVGNATSCQINASGIYWDAASRGLSGNIDAFTVVVASQAPPTIDQLDVVR